MNTVFLKKRMKEKNLDVASLADILGFSERYLENVVKGLTPSKRLIRDLARELDCEPSKIAPEVDLSTLKRVLRRPKVTTE